MAYNIPKKNGKKEKETVRVYRGLKIQDLKKDKQDNENRFLWNNECR
jgi:hypothetical protein